ncbi:hypothetical protein [Actinocrispum wychmicini]|uniref:hypothetical protein n=1 Tax=Actinocrispum wychmicini TaxID=1213861 RepID=UPI001047944F|nr:hypothetical protein [Actinocrispum wychmicini]
MDTLGALAHRGGLLVQRPELSVGVVQAVSRTSGLTIELLARQPLDRRDAVERQRDIRAGQRSQPAPRRLLPDFDEGEGLRVGWLDRPDHAQWVFSTRGESSSGDHYEGTDGPSTRAQFELPPTFDEVDLVLAWPEIGFAETVTRLSLPDRATVAGATVSVWQAPVNTTPVPRSANQRTADMRDERPHIEAGSIVAQPRVLHRGRDAVVVLTRLTEIDSLLSLELVSIARNSLVSWPDPGATLAVLAGDDVVELSSGNGESTGGNGRFHGRCEFVVERPATNVLDLLVAWTSAKLWDVQAQIQLE